MKKIVMFDTKAYEKPFFERANRDRFELIYLENKLSAQTISLAKGADGVVAFVNDSIDKGVIHALTDFRVPVIAMRSAGYNNVDLKAAYKKLTVLRVPYYSPHAVAEHAAALLLCLDRKLHKAYNRTRDYNFSLDFLMGFDLCSKRVGVVGTGKIGKVFARIMEGFGCDVVCYDKYPDPTAPLSYVELDELLRTCDIISLHCPLTPETHHLIDLEAIRKMKHGAYLINTSRGALIDSFALLDGLRTGKLGAAGLDVYEEEATLFFEDFSASTVRDEVLSVLITLPNVLLTAHQAFLTREALEAIAAVTLDNLEAYYSGAPLPNEVCYHCMGPEPNPERCRKKTKGRCF